jgi:hypothetical protein
MPVTYTFSADRRTVRTRCAGHVTLEEVVEHFRGLERDPLCPAQLDVFLDLSELDVASIPHNFQISRVVLEMKRIESRVRFGACAILAPRDALFGMMRMFEAMADQNFRATRSFRDATEAEVWLASQQSHSETGAAPSLPSRHSTS